jgi:hypothetical protein
MSTTESSITVISPKDITEARSLAQTLSKSALLPEALRGKEPDILMTIMTGAELGLAPMQSIRAIDVIKGKPCLKAEAMVALVRRRRDVCEFFNIVHSDERKCIIEAKRVGGAAFRLAWTIEDAQRAGLMGNDNWKRFPAAMLRARCSSAVCKAEFSDLILGLYDPEELATQLAPDAKPQVEREVNAAPVVVEAPPASPPVVAEVVAAAPPSPPRKHRFVEEAPPAEVDPITLEVVALRAAIERATDEAALNALVPRITALPAKDKAGVRVAWGAKRDALRGGK